MNDSGGQVGRLLPTANSAKREVTHRGIGIARIRVMLTVGLTEAKRRFEELVERAVQGERIKITRYGKLMAEIVSPQKNRQEPSATKAGKHSRKPQN